MTSDIMDVLRFPTDYRGHNSCRQFLPQITFPTLLINAASDPFLDAGGYDRHLRPIRQLYALQCAITILGKPAGRC